MERSGQETWEKWMGWEPIEQVEPSVVGVHWGWEVGKQQASGVADSQGSFCAAGGMGFLVTELRDGNGR